MDALRLIVGLGNPGADYADTRHNAGFLALDRLAAAQSAAWTTDRSHRSRLAWVKAGESKILLCQPQTYMNLSGEAVARVAAYYRVTAGSILVVVDDADLPLGVLRLRPEGSSGGHHGLESVEQHLGTRAYPRLRVGIGREPGGRREITGHVLGRFSVSERKCFERVLDRAVAQMVCWVTDGIAKAMNQFNGAESGPESGKTE